jgi:hypothetical protein
MIEQTFNSLLLGTPAIVAIVGSRIHHMERPENETGSAIVFRRISTVPDATLQGDSGLDAVRLQVDCWADTHMTSQSIAALVRSAVKLAAIGRAVMEINDQDQVTGIKRTIVDFNLWQY